MYIIVFSLLSALAFGEASLSLNGGLTQPGCPICHACSEGEFCVCGVCEPLAPRTPTPNPDDGGDGGCPRCLRPCPVNTRCACGRCVPIVHPPTTGCRPCVELCVAGFHCVCGQCVAAPTPSTGHPGVCPPVNGPGPCIVTCENDNRCPIGFKCCGNGCGRACVNVTRGGGVSSPCSKCGASCSTSTILGGICNLQLKCVSRRLPLPSCCGPLFCPAVICNSPNVSQPTKLPNGCPGCSHCVAPVCSATTCTDGFCWEGRCVKYSGVGEGCNGFILPPRRCRPGLECNMSHIPDAGGVCIVPHPHCTPCPVGLACPLNEQVDDAVSIPNCPPCKRCPCPAGECLPCCPLAKTGIQRPCRPCPDST